jgi:lysozyme family protein
MDSSFDTAIQYVFNDEGGYTERENEPGGAVNHGISFLLFQEMWEKEKKKEKPGIPLHEGKPTFKDLKNLTQEQASYLYKTYVFPLVGFDKLPAGLDYAMVNTATMQGPTGAIKLLQEALGFGFMETTGKLDTRTWDAIKDSDPYKLIGGLLLLQAKTKMNDPRVGKWKDKNDKEQKGFGPGWGNRLWRVWNRSVNLTEHK